MRKITSIRISVALANVYDDSSSSMKKAVLEIRPEYLGDSDLRKLFKSYGIKIKKGEKNFWKNKNYFDELFTLLFPNSSDRIKKRKISLNLKDEERDIIMNISGQETLTDAFFHLLLLHYAMKEDTMKNWKKNITNYYNTSIIPVAKQAKVPRKSKTGLKVLGNKLWFVTYYHNILNSLPSEITTLIEPFMGSGTITLESCNHSAFKRIIASDNCRNKTNFIRAFFHYSNALKAACLRLTPNSETYNMAKQRIEQYEASTTQNTDIDVASYYLLTNYCQGSWNTLGRKKFDKKQYVDYLNYLWNSVPGKKIEIYTENALDIISKYNRKKHLAFVDPPYPKTADYEKKFTMEDFDAIVKKILHFNGKFIFCCRITRKHSKNSSHIDTYGINDLEIKNIIDGYFLGNDYYYEDYLYNCNGVAIERVITNFPFTGCYHYDTGQPWQGE